MLVAADARVQPLPTPLGADAMSPCTAAAASLSGQRLTKRQSWRGDDLDGAAAQELQVHKQAGSPPLQSVPTQQIDRRARTVKHLQLLVTAVVLLLGTSWLHLRQDHAGVQRYVRLSQPGRRELTE